MDSLAWRTMVRFTVVKIINLLLILFCAVAHSLDLFFGLYSDSGSKTCAGRPYNANEMIQSLLLYVLFIIGDLLAMRRKMLRRTPNG